MNVLRALSFCTLLGAGILVGVADQVAAQEPQGIRVVVNNHAFLDMHVYVLHAGVRQTLGMATGLSRRDFRLPRVVAESQRDVQLLAEPIGSRDAYVSDVFFVYPGDQLNLTLENYLGLSTTTVSSQRREPEPEEPPEDDDDDPKRSELVHVSS